MVQNVSLFSPIHPHTYKSFNHPEKYNYQKNNNIHDGKFKLDGKKYFFLLENFKLYLYGLIMLDFVRYYIQTEQRIDVSFCISVSDIRLNRL